MWTGKKLSQRSKEESKDWCFDLLSQANIFFTNKFYFQEMKECGKNQVYIFLKTFIFPSHHCQITKLPAFVFSQNFLFQYIRKLVNAFFFLIPFCLNLSLVRVWCSQCAIRNNHNKFKNLYYLCSRNLFTDAQNCEEKFLQISSLGKLHYFPHF